MISMITDYIMSNTIEFFCSAMGIIGTILIARRNKAGYYFYFPSNILWVYYGITTHQFSFMAQYIFYTGMSILGWRHWNNLEKKEVFNGTKVI
jgi:nicotinamide riboside transporter PnuC